MLISKTVMDRQNLIGLQRQLLGTTRTHANDLVALCYAYDNEIDSRTILREPTPMDDMISYTFMWAMPMSHLEKYQFPGVTLRLKRHQTSEDTVGYVVLFTATLPCWIEYCQTPSMPKKFVKVIRDQLEQDGYSQRLLS